MAHTTVSRALNDHPRISADTKLRVKEAALRLGYVANSGARSMRIGSSKVVGLIVPDIQNEFYSAAARAMAGHCAARGYQLVLGVSEDDPAREEQQLRSLREVRACGVLIVASAAPTAASIELLLKMPTVQFLRVHKAVGKRAVLADDAAGVFAATEHLLALGHRRIAFIGGGPDHSTGKQRAAGWRAGLRQRGIEDSRNWMRLGPAQPAFGTAAVQSLLHDEPAITAVVVASSRQLVGVVAAVQRAGIAIPEQLSVVGFGDADWLEVSNPPLSAVALPIAAMCESATAALFDWLESGARAAGKPVPPFPVQLVLRGSTARPRRSTIASRL